MVGQRSKAYSLPPHSPHLVILQRTPGKGLLPLAVHRFEDAGHDGVFFSDEPGDEEVLFFVLGRDGGPFAIEKFAGVDAVHANLGLGEGNIQFLLLGW